MKSVTKISKQTEKKTNPVLVETINLAKKQEAWKGVASILAGSRKNMINLNLREINGIVKEGEKVIIPGKILSEGEVDKKIKITALAFSEGAREKLLNSKIDFNSIAEEIKTNPKAEGLRILKNN